MSNANISVPSSNDNLKRNVYIVDARTLLPHPRNNEFFDDITGDKWEDFKESIRTSGVIDPILVTNMNGAQVIVSGHQRVRAVKEIAQEAESLFKASGILPEEVVSKVAPLYNVPIIIRTYETEEQVLKALIEANIQQRGTINQSKRKQAAIITTLEELYGIKHGGDRKSEKIKRPNGHLISEDPQTTAELAEKLGISDRNYRRVKTLANLLPELADLLEENETPLNYLYQIARNFSKEDQSALLGHLKQLPAFKENFDLHIRENVRLALEKHDKESNERYRKLAEEKDKIAADKKYTETLLLNAKKENQQLHSELELNKTILAKRPEEMEKLEAMNRQLLADLTEERNEKESLKLQTERLQRTMEEDDEVRKTISKILALQEQIDTVLDEYEAYVRVPEEAKAKVDTLVSMILNRISSFRSA